MPSKTKSKSTKATSTKAAEAPESESNRVTFEQVEAEVKNLNSLFNAPEKPYKAESDGTMVPQPGAFFVERDKGGVAVRRVGEGGAIQDVLNGFHPKRQTLDLLTAFRNGYAAK